MAFAGTAARGPSRTRSAFWEAQLEGPLLRPPPFRSAPEAARRPAEARRRPGRWKPLPEGGCARGSGGRGGGGEAPVGRSFLRAGPRLGGGRLPRGGAGGRVTLALPDAAPADAGPAERGARTGRRHRFGRGARRERVTLRCPRGRRPLRDPGRRAEAAAVRALPARVPLARFSPEVVVEEAGNGLRVEVGGRLARLVGDPAASRGL